VQIDEATLALFERQGCAQQGERPSDTAIRWPPNGASASREARGLRGCLSPLPNLAICPSRAAPPHGAAGAPDAGLCVGTPARHGRAATGQLPQINQSHSDTGSAALGPSSSPHGPGGGLVHPGLTWRPSRETRNQGVPTSAVIRTSYCNSPAPSEGKTTASLTLTGSLHGQPCASHSALARAIASALVILDRATQPIIADGACMACLTGGWGGSFPSARAVPSVHDCPDRVSHVKATALRAGAPRRARVRRAAWRPVPPSYPSASPQKSRNSGFAVTSPKVTGVCHGRA
jgi:hypothetical protein